MIEELVHIKDQDKSIYVTGCFLDASKNVHGIYISEKIADQATGLYCALSSLKAPGITEWMDYHFFKYLHESGYKQVYLGGSETSGVHQYVQKLSPMRPLCEMYPLTYTPKTDPIK